MKSNLNSNTNVDVIPNGVNFNIFRPIDKLHCRKELGLKANFFYALFLANPKNNEKNFPLAESAINCFKKNNNLTDVELLVITNVSHNDIVKYINACDVLLFTSFLEGSPNAVKEAMACNLPIVSTDVGNVKEIVNGTENCFIVSYDAEIISLKLKIIYDNRVRTDGGKR